jgi:hypothetical protein
MNRLARWIIGGLLSCCLEPTLLVHAAARADVHWPNGVEILQGGLAEVRIGGGILAAVEGRVGQTPVYFQQSGGSSFTGLMGADIEAKPGISKLLLLATTRRGTILNARYRCTSKPRRLERSHSASRQASIK